MLTKPPLPLFLAVLLSLTGCASSRFVVKPVVTAKPNDLKMDGVVYALPRTVVHVTVPVVRADAAPGLYHEFAQFFFPDEYDNGGVVKARKTTFKLGKPGFSTTSEPDPTQVFYVAIRRGRWDFFQDLTAKLALGPDGVLTSGTADVTNTAAEVAIGAANLAAGVLARTALAAPMGGGSTVPAAKKDEFATNVKPAIKQCKSYLLTPDEALFVDAIGKASGLSEIYTGADDQLLYCQLRLPLDLLPNPYDFFTGITDGHTREAAAYRFRRAAQAYRELRDLGKQASNGLNSGLSPQPDQLQAQIANAIQKEAQRLFLGTVAKETWNGAFTVRPAAAGATTLMTISKTAGVCSIDAGQISQGVVLDPDFQTDECKTAADAAPVKLEVQKVDAADVASLASAKFKTNPKEERGFAYRIPSPATMVLRRGDTELARDQARIAQLGVPVTLPASLGAMSSTYDFTVDSATGALTSLNFGRRAFVQRSMLDAAGTNANALLDARRAQQEKALKDKKAAESANSIDAQLEHQQSIMEKQAAIIKACKELGLTCDLLVDAGGNAVKKQ